MLSFFTFIIYYLDPKTFNLLAHILSIYIYTENTYELKMTEITSKKMYIKNDF